MIAEFNPSKVPSWMILLELIAFSLFLGNHDSPLDSQRYHHHDFDGEDPAIQRCRQFAQEELAWTTDQRKILDAIHEIHHGAVDRDPLIIQLAQRGLELDSSGELSPIFRNAMATSLYNLFAMRYGPRIQPKTSPRPDRTASFLITKIRDLYLEGSRHPSSVGNDEFQIGFACLFYFIKSTYPQYFQYIGYEATLLAFKHAYALYDRAAQKRRCASYIAQILLETGEIQKAMNWRRRASLPEVPIETMPTPSTYLPGV